jgi:hypothetical protein
LLITATGLKATLWRAAIATRLAYHEQWAIKIKHI